MTIRIHNRTKFYKYMGKINLYYSKFTIGESYALLIANGGPPYSESPAYDKAEHPPAAIYKDRAGKIHK